MEILLPHCWLRLRRHRWDRVLMNLCVDCGRVRKLTAEQQAEKVRRLREFHDAVS